MNRCEDKEEEEQDEEADIAVLAVHRVALRLI